MNYTRWLAERMSVVVSAFGRVHMPYERTVCLWAWNLRLAFALAPALLMAWWWQSEWPAFGAVPRPALLSWAAYTVWGAGWLGGFAWADMGPGELFVKALIHRPSCFWRRPGETVTGPTWWCCGGAAYVPNILNTTLEGYEGPKDPTWVARWQDLKYAVLRPWDGDPGAGEFGHE